MLNHLPQQLRQQLQQQLRQQVQTSEYNEKRHPDPTDRQIVLKCMLNHPPPQQQQQ
jgi:hypothetical protein